MSRLDRLQENNLVARLKQVNEDLEALKTAQRVGSDAVVMKRIVSGNDVDFTTTFGYHDLRIWEVTITPEDSTYPNAGFIWAVFYSATQTGGSGSYRVYTESQPGVSLGEVNRLYMMGTTPASTMTWDIKYVIYSLGSVNVSIAQIA